MMTFMTWVNNTLCYFVGTSEYLNPDTAADLEEILNDDAPRDLGKLTTVLNEVKRIQAIQKSDIMEQQNQSHVYASNNPSGSYQSMQGGHNMYNAGPDVFDPNNHYL